MLSRMFILGFVILSLALPRVSFGYEYIFSKQWSGKILLQVEEAGEAWYVNPVDLRRYYLGTPANALEVMSALGLGISNKDLARLPQKDTLQLQTDESLVDRLLGRIVLQVEKAGEAWYIDPEKRVAIYLGTPSEAWGLMREKGHGFTNEDLARIGKDGDKTKKPEAIVAKGVYLTAYSAGSASKRKEIIDLITSTELNTVVIDIKDASGYVFYDSNLEAVTSIRAEKIRIPDIHAVIQEFKDAGVYVIARQVVFLDPLATSAHPEWGALSSSGGLWKDDKGQSWADPTVPEVWEYNMAIAREVIDLGVDEINFDYIRFPSDGPVSLLRFHNWDGSRSATMKKFFEYIGTELADAPAYVSVDFFGLTLDNAESGFDLNIGQQLVDASPHVDYIYPMTYPSHYYPGYLGFTNPAEHPYEVVSHGLTQANTVMEDNRAELRIWIQAFHLGATYDGDKIRAQITATEENKNTQGWVLWNAANRYTNAGLKANY